jgi:O-antigen/teichoic acid export membrane protein
MSLRKKAAKGIVWSVVQKWGREGLSFITFTILARLLAPDAFGLVTLAYVYIEFIEIFMDIGFSAAIVQRTDLEREHLNTAFWMTVSVGAVIALSTVAAAGSIATLFSEPRLASVLKWLSIDFILTSLSNTQMAILQRDLAFKSLAARSMAARITGGIAGVSMAVAGFGVWSLVGQKLVSGAAGVIVLWRASDWQPGFKVSKEHYKDLFNFGVSVAGNNILKNLTQHSDDFLIGYFLGPTLLGYYTIGYKLLLIVIRLVTGIINAVAFPTFSRLQQNPKKLLKGFYKVTQYTSLLAFPVFMGLAILAPQLVPALFGSQWTPSVPVMQVLALIGILQSVTAFNGSVLRASGKPSWELGIMSLTAVCSVIGFLLSVHWGIVAVATSYVIVGYLLAPVSYLAIRKLFPIDIKNYLGQFMVPLLASLVMVAVVEGLKHALFIQGFHDYLQLFIYVLAGTVSYLLIIFILARSLSWQVLDLVNLALPSRMVKKN